VLKFFESLRRGSLEDSISTAFKARAAAVEGAWLKRVREYRASDDHTAAEEAGPRLEQRSFPAAVRPRYDAAAQAPNPSRLECPASRGDIRS